MNQTSQKVEGRKDYTFGGEGLPHQDLRGKPQTGGDRKGGVERGSMLCIVLVSKSNGRGFFSRKRSQAKEIPTVQLGGGSAFFHGLIIGSLGRWASRKGPFQWVKRKWMETKLKGLIFPSPWGGGVNSGDILKKTNQLTRKSGDPRLSWKEKRKRDFVFSVSGGGRKRGGEKEGSLRLEQDRIGGSGKGFVICNRRSVIKNKKG